MDTSTDARLAVKNQDVVQLYSAATPNGIKVAAMLEELVALKEKTGEPFAYEPHTIDIRKGESRSEWFALVAPHGKIPLIVDPHAKDGTCVSVFESGAILLYLADKYDELIAHSDLSALRADTLKWLFWGSTAVSSQFKLFGFYYKYCTHKLPCKTFRL
jgi:GST-like protein